MTTHRFDDRVAIVTGAGRGIGRAYAHLLAARGARVVVNDLGAATTGDGADPGPAAAVVAEITAAGGEAVADPSDVATEAGAHALVETARDAFGRIDVVVSNAGIIRWAGLPEVDATDVERHLAVHAGGSFLVIRAAWPDLVAQRYGRIVLTTSAGVFGLPQNVGYATAKGAVIGLMRSLATAGREHGIAVNCIAPAAFTRMAGPPGPGTDRMDPALVAPLVALLAHEDCPVTGEIYTAGAGRFARVVVASNHGWVATAPEPTVEDVAAHWGAINALDDLFVPADLPAWSRAFLAHLAADGTGDAG